MTTEERFKMLDGILISIEKSETRIDKILIGIGELKESQKKTDLQLMKTDAQIAKTDVQLAKTDAQLAKTDAQLAKTDAQLAKTDAQMERSDKKWEKVSAKIDKLGKLYGNSENKKGIVVEEFFYRYFLQNKQISDITFDTVDRNIIINNQTEHDIFLINGKSSALISVKYDLKKKDIDSLIEKELVQVRTFYKRVGSHLDLYGGVASFIVSDEVEQYAKKKGVFVFTRSGKAGELLNNQNFIPTVF